MAEWSFLTNHARALVCIAHDPGVRLRDIATTLDITERSAYSIVADLTAGGYVVKDKDGRRNRYQIQPHLPLPGCHHRGTHDRRDARRPRRVQASRDTTTSPSLDESDRRRTPPTTALDRCPERWRLGGLRAALSARARLLGLVRPMLDSVQETEIPRRSRADASRQQRAGRPARQRPPSPRRTRTLDWTTVARSSRRRDHCSRSRPPDRASRQEGGVPPPFLADLVVAELEDLPQPVAASGPAAPAALASPSAPAGSAAAGSNG